MKNRPLEPFFFFMFLQKLNSYLSVSLSSIFFTLPKAFTRQLFFPLVKHFHFLFFQLPTYHEKKFFVNSSINRETFSYML